MDGEVVEDHDIAGSQRRHQDLLDVGTKACGIDGAIEDRGRGQAVGPKCRHHRVGLPMAVRRVVAEPHAARTAAVPPQQVGRHTAFIDEDVLADVPQGQPVAPAAAVSRDVGASLFVRVDGFF